MPSKQGVSLVRYAERCIVVAIGLTFGQLFWLGLGPLPEPPSATIAAPPPVVQSAALGSANAFKNGSVAQAITEDQLVNGPDLAETTLNLTLHGTWVDASGGTAIIKTPDDKQGRYQRGATVWENVTLERVFRDQAVIKRDGVLESLRLVGREPSAASPKKSKIVRSGPEQEGEIFATLGSFISIAPESNNVGGVNLVLEPGEDLATFLASGLRPGDILVGVDGEPLGRDVGADIEYLQKIGSRDKVTVNVDRGGVVTPIEVNLKGLTANGG
ncbi:MAG: type II secretion system protein N [Parvularculaceae bacterium]|nr:type II secretion system protein N [Parvularculaceae bacterium]